MFFRFGVLQALILDFRAILLFPGWALRLRRMAGEFSVHVRSRFLHCDDRLKIRNWKATLKEIAFPIYTFMLISVLKCANTSLHSCPPADSESLSDSLCSSPAATACLAQIQSTVLGLIRCLD